jgi:hypothetical protein
MTEKSCNAKSLDIQPQLNLRHPTASVALVPPSNYRLQRPATKPLTDCNLVYDLPGTGFPDYFFQFITFSLLFFVYFVAGTLHATKRKKL